MADAAHKQNNRLAIVEDSLLVGHDFHLLPLRHPRIQESSLFAFSQDYAAVFEVVNHEMDYGSWLIDSDVCSSKVLSLMTPCDPVYLALPYLIKQNTENANKYCPLDQILEDAEFPHTRKLCRCSAISHLSRVADVKDLGDLVVYRYSKEKCLLWLEKKVLQVIRHLKVSDIYVGSGSQAAGFSRGQLEFQHEDDYLRYAFGLVSDYLPSSVREQLREFMHVPKEVIVTTEEPSSKKTKKGSGVPLEDYSKSNILTENQSIAQKMSANQKKFAKVDKTGMRSITSFFAPKSKTKTS